MAKAKTRKDARSIVRSLTGHPPADHITVRCADVYECNRLRAAVPKEYHSRITWTWDAPMGAGVPNV
jgi:hypothetical protein